MRTFFGSLIRQVFVPVQMAVVAKDFVLTAADLSVRYSLWFLFPVLVFSMVIHTWPPLAAVGTLAGLFGTLLRIVITVVVPWKTGRKVAELHPGKELPAFAVICAAALMLSAISGALGAPWNSILSQEPWVMLRWKQIPLPWNPMLTLISMILMRRRWLRKEGTPA